MTSLHVTNGDSLARSIVAAGIPGDTTTWADPLHEGPVPAVPDDELIEIRAAYLSGIGSTRTDAAAELRRWRTRLDAGASCDEIVLWYEHDLFDQLNLIQVLDRLATAAQRAPRVSLVSIDHHPARPHFRGMGELASSDIAGLFLARVPVFDQHYETAVRAWSAFRASTTDALHALVHAGTVSLPFLSPALRRHLEELPSAANGLSLTEQRLLTFLRHGSRHIADVFHHLHEEEDVFFIGDTSFWRIVLDLNRCDPSLLTVEATGPFRTALPSGTLSLTPFGLRVLNGDEHRVVSCGIDRWFGGMHLFATPAPRLSD